MCQKYTRAYILLPRKPETLALLGAILQKLCSDFGGATLSRTDIPYQVEGIWLDRETGNIIKDNHILLWVDVNSTEYADIDRYFTDFKRAYEKRLNEKELWITLQPIMKVA